MNGRTKIFFAAALLLLLSVLACTINVGGPAYPTPTIPISTEAAGELNTNIQTAVAAGVDSGVITLVLTEPELTSYLYYRLANQTDPFITNPQVYLRDNQMSIYGTAAQGNFEAYVKIVVAASVDAQGQLQIDLTTVDFGPLPVPTGLNDIVTAVIKEAYTGALGPVATGFRLETINIADGTMTITGRTK
jgi:hypothetical protein